MNDADREHLLHKIVAGSAFLFALSILPIAQYFLVSSEMPQVAAGDTAGEVAGVSTVAPGEEETVQAVVAGPTATPFTPAECLEEKEKDFADLELFSAGKKAALLREYDASVAPYRQALLSLDPAGTGYSEEKTALEGLINQEYQPYLKRVTDVQGAVDSQKDAIASRPCPSV